LRAQGGMDVCKREDSRKKGRTRTGSRSVKEKHWKEWAVMKKN